MAVCSSFKKLKISIQISNVETLFVGECGFPDNDVVVYLLTAYLPKFEILRFGMTTTSGTEFTKFVLRSCHHAVPTSALTFDFMYTIPCTILCNFFRESLLFQTCAGLQRIGRPCNLHVVVKLVMVEVDTGDEKLFKHNNIFCESFPTYDLDELGLLPRLEKFTLIIRLDWGGLPVDDWTLSRFFSIDLASKCPNLRNLKLDCQLEKCDETFSDCGHITLLGKLKHLETLELKYEHHTNALGIFRELGRDLPCLPKI
jgi:hypothetical protein